MLVAPDPEKPPTRARVLLAAAFVALIIIGVWKFIDYRTQPPPPPSPPSSESAANR
jgi:hypothetical protein